MNLRLGDGSLHRLDLRTRMPFKYGIATMTETPHVFLRLAVEIDGRPATGVSADHLPPKWFTKDPQRPVAEEIDEMLRVLRHAVSVATGVQATSPFDAWRQVHESQAAWGRAERLPPLLTQFGTSLVERAMLDAVCRAAGRPFAALLRDGQLGVDLGTVHPILAGHEPPELLPERPLEKITLRHTVGMADPLTEADVADTDRLHDGLPQSLAACIAEYGLRHFKIKVRGDLAADRDRLLRLAAVIGEGPADDFRFSLDGNEQFRSAAEFRSYWEQLTTTPELKPFFTHLLFAEQPLHRDVALDPDAGNLTAWPGRPPLIIDESDGDLDCLPRALELDYVGGSHKNCKGVFHGVANACLLAHRRRKQQPGVLSGEDLANIGPVALLQDLAVCATLGAASVERNGHHYFAGLSMFPDEVQRQILRHHGDLYRPSQDGWPTLNIVRGELSPRSVVAAPFGTAFLIDLDAVPRCC